MSRYGDFYENSVTGELGTRIDRAEKTLSAGQEETVPIKTPHDWWNAGRIAFGILGTIGGRRGCMGIYPEYLGPHGRTTPDPDAVSKAGIATPAAAHTG